MTTVRAAILRALVVVALVSAARAEMSRPIPAGDLRSGSFFQSATTRAEQDDLDLNPGMLWVDQGLKAWADPAGGEGRSCAGCHGAISGMKGVAARYPRIDAATGTLMNLADRIRQCRSSRQHAPELEFESQELLSLTSAIAFQSRGTPLQVDVSGAASVELQRGRALYEQRQGQLNLSCANCHDSNWGKHARNETISQGHPNGFPAYRLEWQTLGSLERRLKACFLGVRAEPLAPESAELRQLELYLAWRAEGLPLEAPAVRR